MTNPETRQRLLDFPPLDPEVEHALVRTMDDGIDRHEVAVEMAALRADYRDRHELLPVSWGINEKAFRRHSTPEAIAAHDELLLHCARFIMKLTLKEHNHAKAYDEVDDTFDWMMSAASEQIWEYRPDSESALLTWVSNAIRWKRSRVAAQNYTQVRLPVHVYESIRALRRAESEDADSTRVSIRMKLGSKALKTAEDVNNYLWRVDSIDGDRRLHDYFDIEGQPTRRMIVADRAEMIPSNWDEEMHAEIENELLAEELNKAMMYLNERERGVIRLRFGMDSQEPLTLEEVAEVYGVSRERIRQIESKALAILRNPHRSRGLDEFLVRYPRPIGGEDEIDPFELHMDSDTRHILRDQIAIVLHELSEVFIRDEVRENFWQLDMVTKEAKALVERSIRRRGLFRTSEAIEDTEDKLHRELVSTLRSIPSWWYRG